MSVATIFELQLVLGYVACLLAFRAYVLPKLRSLDRAEAHRAIATFHSFRFFGLVFIVPGLVGPHVPAAFATVAAWGDFSAGILALLAVLTFRIRPVFWLFTVAFNLIGIVDIVVDYVNAVRLDLPAVAGQLGATYFIPVLYVPLLMATHVLAFYWLLRPEHASHTLRDAVVS